MQTLGVISFNIWGIIISLCNLVILFLILKKFLYGPVTKTLAARTAAVDEKYSAADKAKADAEADREQWREKLDGAKSEADSIVSDAAARANLREQKMLDEAKVKAEGIIRAARSEADSERERAQSEIRSQIADVSAAIAEKLLEREINSDDRERMINDFIDGIGGAGE